MPTGWWWAARWCRRCTEPPTPAMPPAAPRPSLRRCGPPSTAHPPRWAKIPGRLVAKVGHGHMSWLKKLMPARIRTEAATSRKRSVPEGLWEKCDKCGAVLYRPELEENLEVFPKCGHHMKIRARARLAAFLDEGTGTEIGAGLGPVDVLKFKDQKKYSDRIKAAQKSSGERDALVAMEGALAGRPIVACAFDFAFMGGSMGSVVGERFALAAERACEIGAPLVCFSASGGARMQESLFSLMQMAKTSAALGRLRAAGLP